MIDVPPAASGTDAGTAPASGNGALHAGTGTGGAYVPIGRAAALRDLSCDRLRKRPAAGSVRARKVDSRWWIWVDGAAPSADVDDLAAAPPPEAAGPAPEPNPPVPEAAGTPPEAAPAPPG